MIVSVSVICWWLTGVVSIPMSMYQTVVGSIPTLSGQSIIISPHSLHDQSVTSQAAAAQGDGLSAMKVDHDQLVVSGSQLSQLQSAMQNIKTDSSEAMDDGNRIQVVTIDAASMHTPPADEDTDSDT